MALILVIVSQVLSRDGKIHTVSLYVDVAAEITVNNGTVEEVSWNAFNSSTWDGVRVGSTKQDIFGLRGDGATINWGYLHCLVSSTPTNSDVVFRRTLLQSCDYSITEIKSKRPMRCREPER